LSALSFTEIEAVWQVEEGDVRGPRFCPMVLVIGSRSQEFKHRQHPPVVDVAGAKIGPAVNLVQSHRAQQ
jgi:hypothetical protein